MSLFGLGSRKSQLNKVVFLITYCLAVILIALLTFNKLAANESRLDRILSEGNIIIGTRTDVPPFAEIDKNGKFNGFSVDIGKLIATGLSKTFGTVVAPKFVPVSAQNRFEKVISGDVDLVCGITTMTWAREQYVDFTLPIFVSGTRILSHRDSKNTSLKDLRGKLIGVVENTTTAKILRTAIPGIKIKHFSNLEAAINDFVEGGVHGVANAGAFLALKREKLGGMLTMEVIPKNFSLASEVLACVIPENDSLLRDSINKIIHGAYFGIDEYQGQYADIYFAWFGSNGKFTLPMSDFKRSLLFSSQLWLQD